MLEVEKSSMDLAGQTRLDQIRASLTGQLPAAAPAPAVPLAKPAASDATAVANATTDEPPT